MTRVGLALTGELYNSGMEISYRQYRHQQVARHLKSGPETTEHTPPAEWHSGGVNSEHVWPGQQVQSGDYSLHYLFAL